MDKFDTNPDTKYWIISLDSLFWNQLKSNFIKGNYHIATPEKADLNQSDIIIYYQKHRTPTQNGFVGMAEISSALKLNSEPRIKVYNDQNMNKYYCSVKKIVLFENVCRLSELVNFCKENAYKGCSETYYRKNLLRKLVILYQADKKIGEQTVEALFRLSDDIKQADTKQSDSKSDSESDSEISYIESDTDSEYTDNEGTREVIGHIPILGIPCDGLVWDTKSYEQTANNFKKHYMMCKKCEWTNNNSVELSCFFKTNKMYCQDIKDNGEISKYIELYHNLKSYRFVMSGDDKSDCIYVYRINQRGNMYHRCMIIIY